MEERETDKNEVVARIEVPEEAVALTPGQRLIVNGRTYQAVEDPSRDGCESCDLQAESLCQLIDCNRFETAVKFKEVKGL